MMDEEGDMPYLYDESSLKKVGGIEVILPNHDLTLPPLHLARLRQGREGHSGKPKAHSHPPGAPFVSGRPVTQLRPNRPTP